MSREKFNNKYRIPSARLKGWDYTREGAYFITVCTKDRQPFLGEVIDGKMELSALGVIADIMWHEMKSHLEGVELGEFRVMPDHLHGIIILRRDVARNVSNDVNSTFSNVVNSTFSNDVNSTFSNDVGPDDFNEIGSSISNGMALKDANDYGSCGVSGDSGDCGGLVNPGDSGDPGESGDVASNVSTGKNKFMSRISPKSGSLSTIIRGYKSSVTKHANRLGFEFGWHPRFHDHIIRDAEEFERITKYIIDNPANWRPPTS